MRKLFTVLLFALLASGCATQYDAGGVRRTHFFMQRGVMLELTHVCTNHARVYQAGEGFVGDVYGADPRQFPLEPAVMGDDEIIVTVQSLDDQGRVIWTLTEDFRIDRRSTTAKSWFLESRNSRCRGRVHG